MASHLAVTPILRPDGPKIRDLYGALALVLTAGEDCKARGRARGSRRWSSSRVHASRSYKDLDAHESGNLGRPLGYVMLSLIALIGDPIY